MSDSISTETQAIDSRIISTEREVERLRRAGHDTRNDIQSLILGQAEQKLILAQQDKTLAEIKCAVIGNGKPGLLTRIDRVERWIAANTRWMWMVAAAVVAMLLHSLINHF